MCLSDARDSLIESREDYEFYLEADRIAMGKNKGKGVRGVAERLLFHDAWKYERLLRRVEYVQNCKDFSQWKAYYLYLAYRLERRKTKLGIRISPNCFGPGLAIDSAGPIMVNPLARIGANCCIHPGVVIGTQAGFGDRVPSIGDNVYIGPGAKIFGEITIANGTAIGANSVVNKSFFEPNITVAGIPAKKVSDKGSRGLLFDAVEILGTEGRSGAECYKSDYWDMKRYVEQTPAEFRDSIDRLALELKIHENHLTVTFGRGRIGALILGALIERSGRRGNLLEIKTDGRARIYGGGAGWGLSTAQKEMLMSEIEKRPYLSRVARMLREGNKTAGYIVEPQVDLAAFGSGDTLVMNVVDFLEDYYRLANS